MRSSTGVLKGEIGKSQTMKNIWIWADPANHSKWKINGFRMELKLAFPFDLPVPIDDPSPNYFVSISSDFHDHSESIYFPFL